MKCNFGRRGVQQEIVKVEDIGSSGYNQQIAGINSFLVLTEGKLIDFLNQK
jgi:hypothetical protein